MSASLVSAWTRTPGTRLVGLADLGAAGGVAGLASAAVAAVTPTDPAASGADDTPAVGFASSTSIGGSNA